MFIKELAKSILLCCFYLSLNVFSQEITLEELASIDHFAEETSGIEMTTDGLFWTHNDSGGEPELYGFDETGTLIRTITISNATNVDWEDLAQASDGTFYVCDFGNNNNNRTVANGTPLRIYIIPNPMDIVGSSVTAEIIEFDYEDRDLSLTGGEHDFDMEAAFWWNDTLHLFNKIGGDSPSTTVKHYVLPASPGNYTAKIIETINICGASSCANSRKRVTAADISEDGRYVILLTRARMYLFNCFEGSNYLTTGNMREFSFDNTQKEAVVFDTYQDIYITDEKNGPNGGKLYYFSLAPYVFPEMELTALIESSCNESGGGISVEVTGGAPELNYAWDNDQNTSFISGLDAGSYSLVVTDQEGCKIDTLFSLEGGVFNKIDSYKMCEGDIYEFGSQTLTLAGEYTETFNSVYGCDSIVELTLTVKPVFNTSDEVSICDGDSYTFGSQTLIMPGEYVETFSSVSGCDSIVELTLSVTYINTEIELVENTLSVDFDDDLSYQWLNCNDDYVAIEGAVNFYFSPDISGNYAVKINDGNCEALSDCFEFTLLGLHFNESKYITLYPNPVADLLILKSTMIDSMYEIKDLMGRAVQEGVIRSES